MQKLHRLKSPCLKRVVIGLGLVAAVGAGYQLNEAKWQRLLRRQPKETTQNLTQKGFRMDEYTPEGVKIADLNAIDKLPFVNPDSAKFAALKLDSLTVDSLPSIGNRCDEKGRQLAKVLSFSEIERRKNRLAQQQDTVYSEDFLTIDRAYYELVCLEIYKCGKHGENRDLWRKSDDDLRREVLAGGGMIKAKMGVLQKMKRASAYPEEEFNRDFKRVRMAQSLQQERVVRREINEVAGYLMKAREGEFLAAHRQKQSAMRAALYEKANQEKLARQDSFLHPFKYAAGLNHYCRNAWYSK